MEHLCILFPNYFQKFPQHDFLTHTVAQCCFSPLGFHLNQRLLWGFPGGSVIKKPPANAGAAGDADAIPESRGSPRGGNDTPLQYSCLEDPTDRGAWWTTVHGVAKSDMTEQLSIVHTALPCQTVCVRACRLSSSPESSSEGGKSRHSISSWDLHPSTESLPFTGTGLFRTGKVDLFPIKDTTCLYVAVCFLFFVFPSSHVWM